MMRKIVLEQTLIAEREVEVPEMVVALGMEAVASWLDANDAWPDFEEVIRHGFRLADEGTTVADALDLLEKEVPL